MSSGEELESGLRRLLDSASRYRVSPRADVWQTQAISTIVSNVDRYLQAVSSAISSGSSGVSAG